MRTTVYLIRHSKPIELTYYNDSDSIQIQNEKKILSMEGEEIAKKKFSSEEFSNIDAIYCSNYVRTIGTAKYLADKNNISINIDSDFGERMFGFSSWDEKPEDFEMKQFLDENYKFENGESIKEVQTRMYNALKRALKDNSGKRIAIVTHSTATASLLKAWCSINLDSYKFNNIEFFNNKWEYCQTFKLEFNDDKLINIFVI